MNGVLFIGCLMTILCLVVYGAFYCYTAVQWRASGSNQRVKEFRIGKSLLGLGFALSTLLITVEKEFVVGGHATIYEPIIDLDGWYFVLALLLSFFIPPIVIFLLKRVATLLFIKLIKSYYAGQNVGETYQDFKKERRERRLEKQLEIEERRAKGGALSITKDSS